MTLGTLYVFTVDGEPLRTRAILPEALVKHFKLDIALSGPDSHYPSEFPARVVPSYRHANGSILVESIPICFYLLDQIPNQGGLVGDGSALQRAQILSWMSTFNNEIMRSITTVFTMIAGRQPYDAANFAAAKVQLERLFPRVQKHLVENTFLVGEKLSLADLYSATFLLRGFQFFMDEEWRKQNYAVVRWFKTVTSSPIFGGFFDNLEYIKVAKQVSQ